MVARRESPADVLARTRAGAARFAEEAGPRRLLAVLRSAASDLAARIDRQVRLGLGDSFTAIQARVAFAQVERTVATLVVPGIRATVLEVGGEAAEHATRSTVEYMRSAETAYRGVGQGLSLDEARMFERASQGANSSILRRLGADPAHPARPGILARYGAETIAHFEGELQRGVVAKRPWGEIRDSLVKRSPFLQAAPRHWAERIVRTETAGMHGRAALESAKEAHEQLGDVLKVISTSFDDRTGSDSIADHGMIRRVGEQFASWYGSYDAPPDRPNDRAVLVTHRLSWGELPAHLRLKPWSDVVARWKLEGRKGSPPPRNLMSTVTVETASSVGPRSKK